ncbi:septum site-determining protein MinC [Pseudomonas sp. G11-1]|uniref:Probable septum site-determining protein MinC n=1 Tax=Halopseudomonas bauzanensis TaxID=653930 RepID=A0A4V5NMT8_9GAMM|nr:MULTISPECIES: septum site-determining protein MinC [Halopseudomonas]MCO5786385.1 septum site-determining protein MinC [Pseudomonas sp. G11-1]MCO5789611.1 septum site-determining protein MinC [Pseudomonas sp. G11-2]EZQ18490.1 septum formation inhibitor [Halopseudomonas bauzanensis]TKA92437.1 septum site-determining protein MinC [Halopseudomonas bauzanensis]WGK62692.1 septum site-determining protein MinC [Halopseudomonas sp. SMJS2]
MTSETNLDLLDTDPVFQLKGGMLTMTVLELVHLAPQRFAIQLAEKVEQAPNFFQDTPVLISLEKLDDNLDISGLIALLRICRDHGLQPVALRGAEQFRPLAQQASLVLLPPGRNRDKIIEAPEPAPQPVAQQAEAAPVSAPQPADTTPTRVITEPVRSGQQVYARGGDLVVLAPVSAGSELLADGHIHVYGPLRGRALAGVRGDTRARIFCQSLEAELVSVAGQYKVAEDLRRQQWKEAVQISLEGDILKIAAL